MRLLTIGELQLLSRDQLVQLLNRTLGELLTLPHGSAARANALQNEANIRVVLERRGFRLRALKHPSP